MRRLLAAVVAFGLMVGVSVAATADHVQPPTVPITGLDISFFEYPDKTTEVACVTLEELLAGATLDTFEQETGRLHVQVEPGDTPPTEHWTTTVQVSTLFWRWPGKIGESALWDNKWFHQNIGAHTHPNVREAQVSIWSMSRHIGMWRIRVDVTGDESGNFFATDCIFEKT